MYDLKNRKYDVLYQLCVTYSLIRKKMKLSCLMPKNIRGQLKLHIHENVRKVQSKML